VTAAKRSHQARNCWRLIATEFWITVEAIGFFGLPALKVSRISYVNRVLMVQQPESEEIELYGFQERTETSSCRSPVLQVLVN
jgi:hypothetical protein